MLTFTEVLNLADAMLFICALVNIVGLYLLAPVVKRELRDYRAHLRAGRIRKEDTAPRT